MCPEADGYGRGMSEGMTFPKFDLDWCKQLFESVKLGGIWGVPRSGLTFTKTKTGLELSNVMPWCSAIEYHAERGRDVPPNAEALLKYQRSDFKCIQSRFEAAGLSCTDPKHLLGTPWKGHKNGALT